MQNTHAFRVHLAVGFLVVTYAVAAPLTAYFEYHAATVSERFGLPPALIYAVCALQVVFVAGLLVRRWAPWAALGLSVLTLGALGSHLRIGSPLTALPALAYTGLQLWVAWSARAGTAPEPDP